MLSVCCLSGVRTGLWRRRRCSARSPTRSWSPSTNGSISTRLGPVAELADRVIRCPYAEPVERTLRWLHAQTPGDWVFRIDDDEMPCAALLGVLAAPACATSAHCLDPAALALARRLARRVPVAARLAAAPRPPRGGAVPGASIHIPVQRRRPGTLPRGAALPPRPGGEHARGAREKTRRYGRVRPGLRARRPSAERRVLPPRAASRRVRRAGAAPTTSRSSTGVAGAEPSRGLRLAPALRSRDAGRRWTRVGQRAAARARLRGADRAALRRTRVAGEVRELDVAVTNSGTRPGRTARRPARDPASPTDRGRRPGRASGRRFPHPVAPGGTRPRSRELGARPREPGRYTLDRRPRPRTAPLVRLRRPRPSSRSRRVAEPSSWSGSRPATTRSTARVDEAACGPRSAPRAVARRSSARVAAGPRSASTPRREPPGAGRPTRSSTVPAGRRRDRRRLCDLPARRLRLHARG